MSVVGFDVGNMNAVISAARQGGIEVLANEYSYRVTSCHVSLTAQQRFIGEAGRSQETTNPKNTVSQFKRLVGRKYRHPDTQLELARANYRHKEMPDGGIGIEVSYLGEDHVFTPEQIYAMFLTKLKLTAEKELKKPVVDVVISCSNWFNDAQRRGIIAAAQIAGLNCLRLMNDTTAAALAYGIYKQDLPEDENKPRYVALVDIGHSSMQVAIAAFVKGKLTIKATAADQHLGGRDFDYVLYQHFKKEFQDKHKIDLDQKPRARLRMMQECEKMKKLMSANSSSIPINIECLCDDLDFHSRIDRATFESLAADILARVEKPLIQAVTDAGIKKDELASVEIIGGGTRVPAVKDIIVKALGTQPSTTLNADEAVSRGCALQAAILSPTFRVRDFTIKDATPYAVDCVWKSADGKEDNKATVFARNGEVPSTKMLTFRRSEDFNLTAIYENPAVVPDGLEVLNRFKIKGVRPDKEGNPSKFKVKMRSNPHGIIGVESAHLVEEVLVEEKEEGVKPMETDAAPPASTEAPKEADTPMADSDKPADAPADKMETDEEKPAAAAPAPASGEAKMKKVQRKIELTVETEYEYSQKDIQRYQELEANMALSDRMEIERQHAKNSVEEYVYEMRGKLEDALADYITETDKEKFTSELTKMEDWLYDEGEDQPKKTYQEKLDYLKSMGNPVVNRCNEWAEIPKAEETFRRTIVLFRKVLHQYANNDEKYAHISKEDMEKVEAECNAKEMWLNTQLAANAQKAKSEDPAVTAKDILAARDVLEKACNPIVNKPKPKPATPPPASPKPEAAPADAAAAEEAKPEEPKAEEKPTEMEVDD
eukprot:comp23693_c0_seq1/m.40682 comp23693_c0_seq1/g.40682  ORF comp23693_c0_seq1/g.40682 comp23693_c0_seq1/m.40682 type:complete len:828 (-) comp23693_c0_seq1:493-2976(-)